MARPTKLSKDLQHKICKYIKYGYTYDGACTAAGINISTFYAWKAKGEKAKSGKFLEFSEAIQAANISARSLLEAAAHKCALGGYKITETKTETDAKGNTKITVTEKIAAPDGRIALAILERRFPDDWAKKDKVDITTGDQPLNVQMFGSIGLGTGEGLPTGSETLINQPVN